MVDPTNITRYNLNHDELEEVILFWVCAAGKNGVTAAKCLERLLSHAEKVTNHNPSFRKPFTTFRYFMHHVSKGDETKWQSVMAESMKAHGIGCYNNKAKTFIELIKSNLNLKSCTRNDLAGIWGIGMKTASCYIMHSRPDANCAGLDTHVLEYLRDQGIDAPMSTPASRKKYLELEQKFLNLVPSGKTPAEFDLEIWLEYSGHKRI